MKAYSFGRLGRFRDMEKEILQKRLESNFQIIHSLYFAKKY